MRVFHCFRGRHTAALLILAPIVHGSCPVGAADTLRWGEPSGGLQVAVSVEPEAGFVHGWIRNGETANLTVNNYFLGYFEHLHVEVLDAATWRRLDRAANGMRAFASAGPGKSNIELLRPNHTMTRKRLDDLAVGRTFADLPAITALHSSFGVDLGDFQWPAAILSTDKITIRVVQELAGPGFSGPVVVCSEPIELEPTQFGELLEELNSGLIYHRDFQDHPPRPAPPASPPPGGTIIFARDFRSGTSLRVEQAVTTHEEEGPLGRKAHAFCSYTLLTANPDAPNVVVWVKRGPVAYARSKQRAGIVPFEAVEHDGWISFLYTYFSGLCLDTFRIGEDGKAERAARQGLGSFSLAPSANAVGFQQNGKELKVVFHRSPDEFPRSDFVFTLKEGEPAWLQQPARKSTRKEGTKPRSD